MAARRKEVLTQLDLDPIGCRGAAGIEVLWSGSHESVRRQEVQHIHTLSTRQPRPLAGHPGERLREAGKLPLDIQEEWRKLGMAAEVATSRAVGHQKGCQRGSIWP